MTLVGLIANRDAWSMHSAELTSRSIPERERYDARHLRALLSEALDGRLIRVTDEAALASCDALLWLGGGDGAPAVSAGDVLKRVQLGAGLLACFDEGDAGPLADLADRLGCAVGPGTLTGPNGREAHLLGRTFAAQVCAHAATGETKTIVVSGARSLISEGEHHSLAITATGESLALASPLGEGRVVLVGDVDWLARPFVGREDNAKFVASALAWAAGLAAGPVADLGHRDIPNAHGDRDVSSLAGAHLFDCRPWHDVLADVVGPPMVSPWKDPEGFLAEAELRFARLPDELRGALLRFRRSSGDIGAIVLRGLPLDHDLPPTPTDGRPSHEKRTFTSELWLGMVGTALGDPVSFAPLKRGELFQSISPTRINERALSSESSRVLLDYHTELAYHPLGPTHLLLFCLRADHERVAKTVFTSARQVLDLLSPSQLATLFQPRFRAEVDISFRGRSQGGEGIALPVFYGDPFDPMMNFDGDLIRGDDDEARAAYRALADALAATRMYVRLEPGDLLVLDNRRVTHGRSEFEPRYDGYDRWLQRLYVGSLNASIDDRRPGSRVIETEFAA